MYYLIKFLQDCIDYDLSRRLEYIQVYIQDVYVVWVGILLFIFVFIIWKMVGIQGVIQLQICYKLKNLILNMLWSLEYRRWGYQRVFNFCINDIEYNIFYIVYKVWIVQLVKNVFFRNFKVVCGWGGGVKLLILGILDL